MSVRTWTGWWTWYALKESYFCLSVQIQCDDPHRYKMEWLQPLNWTIKGPGGLGQQENDKQPLEMPRGCSRAETKKFCRIVILSPRGRSLCSTWATVFRSTSKCGLEDTRFGQRFLLFPPFPFFFLFGIPISTWGVSIFIPDSYFLIWFLLLLLFSRFPNKVLVFFIHTCFSWKWFYQIPIPPGKANIKY